MLSAPTIYIRRPTRRRLWRIGIMLAVLVVLTPKVDLSALPHITAFIAGVS